MKLRGLSFYSQYELFTESVGVGQGGTVKLFSRTGSAFLLLWWRNSSLVKAFAVEVHKTSLLEKS